MPKVMDLSNFEASNAISNTYPVGIRPIRPQGDRPVLEYIAEYDNTFVEAQSAELPDWQKINDIRQGLNGNTG